MIYSREKEAALLDLLDESNDPNGVGFSWEKSHHPQNYDHVADAETEYHLDEMVKQGWVEKRQGTKDGARYLLARQGAEQLELLTKESGLAARSRSLGKRVWAGVIVISSIAVFLFRELLDPSVTCSLLPEVLSGILERCDHLGK